ncbi:MAG: hypothetical protein M3O32_00220, partial [Actinomycetota bacterium]|nr:hypothetical protein [Actinomycetota bacterium]
MTPEVPPAKTVVPDPYVVTPLTSPVGETVTRRRVVTRDVTTGTPVNDTSPWLWLLGLLVLLLIGFLLYLG